MKRQMKMAAALLATTAIVVAGVPVMAAPYTTSDSVLTLETPDDTWKEIKDPNTWVTLANGSDTITLLHYNNGASLPGMTVANDQYTKVYQTVISTQNEVFIVTGSVADQTDYQSVKKAVDSVVINKYDTKKTSSTSKFTIKDEDAIRYVSSGSLNVRSSYSTTASIIGNLSYGDKVHVTGLVKENGENIGWYQIDYNGGSGFISSNFVQKDQPQIVNDDPTPTNNSMTLYSSDGDEVVVTKYSDGYWYDGDGNRYAAEGAGQWSCSDGSYWTTQPYEDDTDDYDDGDEGNEDTTDIKLVNDNGDYVYIHEDDDGQWSDNQAVTYEAEGAGQWSDSNGGTWHIDE